MTLAPDQAMTLASEAYLASTSYFDNSIRREIEADLRRFQGLHPTGSKYLADRSRSRLFRPKTRTALRKHEAIAAEAFFSTRDVVSIEPQDDNDEVQQASAELMKQLLQHRLTKTIPWFQTLLGAYQDAMTVGLVCSYQHWVFDKKKKKDEPAIRLIPLENVRFDPGANWMDPVNSSPYFIEMIPMYVKDVRARMKEADEKTGQPKWKTLDDASILQAVRGYSDSTRITRENNRTDSKEQAQTITAYSIVWVHKNIIEHEGEDYCYYTLGTTALLSDPAPLADRYWHGKRPYVIGSSVIETHKNYPSGPNRLGKEVQAEANEVANLRIENVKLVLNKRYFVKRNRQVDLRSLTRGVAGGATLMTDPESDVVTQEFNDVTASSYKEQEVLNGDFDDIMGTFSGSSVSSNRKLGETVGGLEMLNVDANQVSGYQLRTFVESYVEPVLRQMVLLEQHYETDEVILALAGQKANLFEKFNIDAVTDELLEQELTLSVGVGMGATNPQEKVNRFLTAMRSLKEMLMDGILQQNGLKVEEVTKEIFANLGYRDGSRFFDTAQGEDPQVTQLKQTIAELQAQVAQKMDPKLVDATIRKIDAEVAAMTPKSELAKAQAVKTGVDAAFSAMQAAEVIAAVPEVAPIADAIMQGANYQRPTPAGADPNFPQPNADAATMAPPGGIDHLSGGAPGDTSPNTPATAGTGAGQGIETQEADSVGLANGGLVGDDMDPLTGLTPMQASRKKDGMDPRIGEPFKTFYGAGNILSNFADGGLIQGSGTGTSDSIPAVNTDTGDQLAVSNQEFKVSAAVVQAMGVDFFEELIAKYHTPVEGQPPIYQGTAESNALGMKTNDMIIPADVVQAVGVDVFEELERRYAQQ